MTFTRRRLADDELAPRRRADLAICAPSSEATMTADKVILTLTEAAQLLGVRPERMSQLTKAGVLQAEENSADRRQKLVTIDDVEEVGRLIALQRQLAAELQRVSAQLRGDDDDSAD